jgi:hypothetical protein
MPAPSALAMPVDARFDPAAATTSDSVGRAAATTRSPSAALDGSAASRMPSSACRSSGTGRGSPGAGRTPCSVSARAISRAKNGFPSEIRWSRSRMGCVRSPPARALSRRVIASSRSGPMDTRWRLGAGPARPRASGSPPEPKRSATRMRIGASSRRRTTNASTLAEGASSHWTSSIAMITGADAASARRTPSDASDTARWSGGAPSSSARRSAASSARCCGAGRSGSSKSNRSPSAA